MGQGSDYVAWNIYIIYKVPRLQVLIASFAVNSRRQSGTQLARQCEWSQVVSTDWITRLHIKFRSSHFDDHVTTAVHKDKYLKTKN